jgi:Trk K+ transport system NAD-binding subunit
LRIRPELYVGMLAGKLFVICGLSRLSARVARSLREQGADVSLIMYDRDPASMTQILPDGVAVHTATAESAASALRAIGLQRASCLLALDEDDLANLRSTVSARSIAPNVPVVMRAFDPMLADQFEQGLNVRRAFSVSALAAPAFAAAAFGGVVVESLRLGNEVIPVCRLVVEPESPIVRRTIEQIERECDVTILAAREAQTPWTIEKPDGARQVQASDELLFSGPPQQCLKLMVTASGWDRRNAKRRSNRGRGAPLPAEKRQARARRRSLNWMPQLTAALLALVLTSTVIFAKALHLDTIDAIYFTITTLTTTGYGDISLMNTPAWVKLFGCLIMLSGGALLGILFSYFAGIATAQRLDIAMARRAERMSEHVIVVGLGNVGYRVTQALTDLDLDVAVMDLAPRARFINVVNERAPVLSGDARLPENLDRAAVRRAVAIIACTSDDLANVETCLHAMRLNPNIRTIARVYDDQIVETLSTAFSIDSVLSATNLAESSFVMAATDSAALRTFDIGGATISAARYRVDIAMTSKRIRELEQKGVQVAAFRSEDGALTTRLLSPHVYETIVCGPDKAIRELLSPPDAPI